MPYKNNREEPSSQQWQSELYVYPGIGKSLCNQPTRLALLDVSSRHPLIQTYVHICTNIIRTSVSICFICAEISVLLQSPMSRNPVLTV